MGTWPRITLVSLAPTDRLVSAESWTTRKLGLRFFLKVAFPPSRVVPPVPTQPRLLRSAYGYLPSIGASCLHGRDLPLRVSFLTRTQASLGLGSKPSALGLPRVSLRSSTCIDLCRALGLSKNRIEPPYVDGVCGRPGHFVPRLDIVLADLCWRPSPAGFVKSQKPVKK